MRESVEIGEASDVLLGHLDRRAPLVSAIAWRGIPSIS